MIKRWVLLIGLAIMLIPGPRAIADEVLPPQDYSKVSQDGQYIFVMFTLDKGWGSVFFKNRNLRRKYAQAGLYKNDSSLTPLWTVDWYSHSREVYLPSDGKHLVRMGPWPSLWAPKDMEKGGPALQELAVAFYESGRLLKRYSIGDLVENPKVLPQSVSHFMWMKEVSFDDVSKRLRLSTLDGNKYVFDVNSGEIIKG